MFCLCIFCPSVYPWSKKSWVVSLTAGSLLVLLQTWSLWYKKIAFHWGHRVSHVSADRALARVKGHSALTNCAVQRPPSPPPCTPSSEFLLPLDNLFLVTSSEVAHEACEALLLWREWAVRESLEHKLCNNFTTWGKCSDFKMPFSYSNSDRRRII